MIRDDTAFKEVIDLLKTHPELMKDLVLDPSRIQQLLKSEEAQELALGQEATEFLTYVGGNEDGYGISQCLNGTGVLCAKGTKIGMCGGGTRSDQ